MSMDEKDWESTAEDSADADPQEQTAENFDAEKFEKMFSQLKDIKIDDDMASSMMNAVKASGMEISPQQEREFQRAGEILSSLFGSLANVFAGGADDDSPRGDIAYEADDKTEC